MKSEFLLVATRVFELERRPLSPKEIVAIAIREGLFSDRRAGKTPYQTMKSKLSVHVRRNRERSPFVRTKPGRFFLRKLLAPDQAAYDSPPLQKSFSGESVLVFPRRVLDQALRFQGIKTAWKTIYTDVLRPNVCEHMNRIDAEGNNAFKQILTYVLVTRGNFVLSYRRGNYSRTEDYLRGSECIGFGGHVSRSDLDLFTLPDMGVKECVGRELDEELRLPVIDKRRLQSNEGLSCIGVLNDDSSEVGRRHLAFIFRYEVSDDPAWDNPERGEKSITQLRWLGPGAKVDPIWRFEYWTQLCLRQFFPRLVRATTTYQLRRATPLTPPHILCVLGTVGSGKSEITKLLCKEYKYSEINTGRVLAELLGIPPVPTTPREEFQQRAWKFIASRNGPNQLARAIWKRIQVSGSNRVLVDGLRQRATLERVKSYTGKHRVGVIYVHTLPDLAYKFYLERERSGCSVFDFLRVRNAPVEKEVEDMIGLADAVLYNWVGIKEYREAIRALISDLISKAKPGKSNGRGI